MGVCAKDLNVLSRASRLVGIEGDCGLDDEDACPRRRLHSRAVRPTLAKVSIPAANRGAGGLELELPLTGQGLPRQQGADQD